MEGKRRPKLSELRVGIFVVVACAVLAVAIFTIGTQVGLLEETFRARTFLNNVSGLKPGDVVLMGGVEVGNVTDVHLVSDTPTTQTNERTREDLDALQASLPAKVQAVADAEAQIQSRSEQLGQARARYGNEARQTIAAANDLDEANRLLNRRERDLDDARERLGRLRSDLQNIAVEMRISDQYRSWIKNDSNISLGSIGLLGDKFIEISLGRTDESPPVIEEKVDGLWGGKTVEVVIVTGTRQAGFQELITGANDILSNFELLSDKLQSLMDKFEEGEGTVGKFLSDDTFYDNLNAATERAKVAADEASTLLRNLSSGKGTIPTLINDPRLHDRILSVADRLDASIKAVNEGTGTLGLLVNDRAVYDKANDTMSSIRQIAKRIADGQGTLGKLSTDDKLYADLRNSIDQLNKLLADVQEGKGTLGRLAKDEQLYQNVNEVATEVVKLIYDFRQNPKKFLTIKFEIF